MKEPAIIEQAFRKAGRRLTPALLDFQLRYGGLLIYVGLEPICFGILHGKLARGDFRHEKNPCVLIEWEPDEDSPHWHYTCADTLYQKYFTLDERGGYYENSQLHATSFDGVLENLAVFEELNALAGYQEVYMRYAENLRLPAEELCRKLHLQPYPDYPAEVIFWGENEQLVVQRGIDELRVFAAGPLPPETEALLDELLQTHSVPDVTAREASAAAVEQLRRRLHEHPSWLTRLRRWLGGE